MKKRNVKYGIACAISLIVLILLAVYASKNESTDIIMPTIYLMDGVIEWYVLLFSLLAEAIIVKLYLKEDYFKTATITLVMNGISVVLGFVTLFIVGLLVELILLPFDTATFHISHWIVTFLFVVLTNACLEGLIIKIGFKYKFKKTFLWLCLANAISFVICFLFHLSWTSSIYF